MTFRFTESAADGNSVLELDDGAVRYFIDGLEGLLGEPAGAELSTAMLVSVGDEATGVGRFILRKVDPPPD